MGCNGVFAVVCVVSVLLDDNDDDHADSVVVVKGKNAVVRRVRLERSRESVDIRNIIMAVDYQSILYNFLVSVFPNYDRSIWYGMVMDA
eukprot:scaffold41083_cov191-Amphora_coffeaeformis.AAC.5